VEYKYLRPGVEFGWVAWAALDQITLIKSTYWICRIKMYQKDWFKSIRK